MVDQTNTNSHPSLQKLTFRLDEFHAQVFVVEFHLRQLGEGYLFVTDRTYEWFTSALSYVRPEDSTAAALRKAHQLDQAVRAMRSALHKAYGAYTELASCLELKNCDRIKALRLALKQASSLNRVLTARNTKLYAKYFKAPPIHSTGSAARQPRPGAALMSEAELARAMRHLDRTIPVSE